MSVIAGIVYGQRNPGLPEDGERIMAAYRNFPADAVRSWQQEDQVFLGCHAQWITPESVEEILPFHDPERKLTITADAILDNREALFDLLQVARSRRAGMPDSQLILLAYAHWGEESPKYLLGDFAFLIWDERDRKLFGARDFSGTRNLYYAVVDGKAIFSSLITPLLAIIGKKGLNEQWLAEYLAITGAIDTVDTASTPYLGIAQVPPHHSVTVSGGKVNLRRYGHVGRIEPLTLRSDKEYIEAFQELFGQAVAARLRARRRVGAYLSGGLDSGAVVGFAAKYLQAEGKDLATFSYVPVPDFADYTPKYLMADERPYIRETVRYVGGIQDHYLSFNGRSPYSEVDSMLDRLETPYKFFENSFWLKGIHEAASQADIGVLLNGSRGNISISWGPALNYYATLFRRGRWIKLAKELDQYSRITGGPRLRRLPLIAGIAHPWLGRMLQVEPRKTLPVLIRPDFARRTDVFSKLSMHGMDQSGWFQALNVYEQRFRHFEDSCHWQASNALGAKLSHASGVWSRDPTNDLRVIRFCLSVPEDQYVRRGQDRALIRRSTYRYLPDAVRLNQRRRGIQGADWVYRMAPQWPAFVEEMRQLCQDERTMAYLNPEAALNALHKIQAGPRTEFATDPDYRVAMRSLIVHRFLQRFG